MLVIYFDEYYKLSDAKKIESKYDPEKLSLKAYNYDIWFENKETNDTIRKIEDLSDIYLTWKVFTSIGLLTRISLTQIKAGNKSNKLKKIRQTLYLLCWHNKIT